MFSARHQALVDNFGGIIAAGVDVDAFLDDRVRARAQSLSDLVSARLDLGLLLRLLAAHRGRPVVKRSGARRPEGNERLGEVREEGGGPFEAEVSSLMGGAKRRMVSRNGVTRRALLVLREANDEW